MKHRYVIIIFYIGAISFGLCLLLYILKYSMETDSALINERKQYPQDDPESREDMQVSRTHKSLHPHIYSRNRNPLFSFTHEKKNN